jgi:predicted ATPase/transcriptional regulator with XRE-family HTH domain
MNTTQVPSPRPDPQPFGQLLKRHRARRRLTQEALAEQAGFSRIYIALLEGGKRVPPPETVMLLAQTLALDEEERAALERAAALLSSARPPTGESVPLPLPGPRAPASAALTPLPIPLTPLVGRDRDVAAVSERLDRAGERLVTIVGPGGVGKTRLALEVATRRASHLAGGAVFVDLAPVADPTLVVPHIARALGVRADYEPLLRAELAAWPRTPTLILLDNVEHLLAAAPAIAGLLAACPMLTILATGRAPLRVRAEHTYIVEPLALPSLRQLPDVAALAQYPAVALLAQRAALVRPGFAITAANAAAVAEICVRLDGLPLALELAAAQFAVLSPRALLDRLGRRLVGETDALRDLPARQRTLRATIAWSHDLLSAPGRRLFRRLAAFGAGGWTLEAAEQVCIAPGEVDVAVQEFLTELVEQNLLWRREQADGELRFGMLETIRDYALEQLTTGDEEVMVRRAHAATYLDLAERAAPALIGPDAAVWLARLEREQDNLRAALQWARQAGRLQIGLRLAAALWRFWMYRGSAREGRLWLDELLARAEAPGAETIPDALLAVVLAGTSRLATDLGDYGAAGALLERCIALRRANEATTAAPAPVILRQEHGDQHATAARSAETAALYVHQAPGAAAQHAFDLGNLGLIAHFQGDLGRSAARHEESLRLFDQLGHARGLALMSGRRALVANEQGDYVRAEAFATRGRAHAEAQGYQRELALALVALGWTARDRGQAGQARALLERGIQVSAELRDSVVGGLGCTFLALALQDSGDAVGAAAQGDAALDRFGKIGHLWGLILARSTRGSIALAQGDLVRAAAMLGAGLTLARHVGTTTAVSSCLEGLAGVAAGRDRLERAACLLGAAAALRTSRGAPLAPVDRATQDRRVGAVRQVLGDSAFAAAWEQGQALPVEQAVALTLERSPLDHDERAFSPPTSPV